MANLRIGIAAPMVAMLLFCLPAPAWAQAGQVIFAAGDVRIVNAAGQERRAVKGAQIHEGETVVSAPGASAQLQMKDGAYVALRPDSRLRVDTYVYNGREDGSENGLLSLLKGGFRTITGFIGRTNKDRYQVRTPTATIGIRGTDHEPYYIAPPAPGERPVGAPGTYTKVNVGIAYIQTPAGSVDVFPNQVGFAAPDQLPQVLPQIPDFFRTSAAPASDPERARVAAEPAAAAERVRVGSDAASTSGVTAQTAPLSAVHAPVPPEPKVPILAEGAGPIDLGNPNAPTYPGAAPAPTTPPPPPPPPTTAIVAATSYPTLFTDDFATLEAGVTRDTATGAPIGFNESYAGFTFGLRLISPNAVAPAFSTSPTAQIDYGRWSGGSVERSFTLPIGNNLNIGEFVNLPRWGHAPEGYLDAGLLISGTFSYVPNASTTPIDSVTGKTGVLTSATFGADFTNLQWSAGIDLDMGAGQVWQARATAVPLTGNSGGAGSLPGAQTGNLSVIRLDCSICTVGGSLEWGFTGQNYQGVMLGYNVFERQGTSGPVRADIDGTVALTRNGVTGNPTLPTPGAPAPTGNVWVMDSLGGAGLELVPAANVSTVVTANGPMLSAYNVSGGGFSVNVSTSAGTVGTVITAPDTGTGIVLGTWDSGSMTQTLTGPVTPGSVQPPGAGQFHWALGRDVNPVYLPQVLTGTLTYSLDAATKPTNQAGVEGALNTASLILDFNKQTVDVGLNLTVDTHNWVASAAGMRLDGRSFDSFDAIGPVTVTLDPATANVAGSGRISGSLTGAGMNGAAVSYALSAGPTESVNGVVAFSAPAQNTAAPYRVVAQAGHALGGGTEPWSFVNGDFNAASRVSFDAATPANLTQFDSGRSALSGRDSVTVAQVGATLTDANSDPATGISWGRWAGGAIDVTDRATGATSRLTNPGSLHWIAGPQSTGPVVLPTSGTFSYTRVGNTNPTDQLGNVGTLNSASLTANFTAMTVDTALNATVAGTTLDAVATGMKITPHAVFGSETGSLAVTCSGASCGTTHSGSIGGAFTGPTGEGAALLYHLTSASTAGPGTSISGAAAFKR